MTIGGPRVAVCAQREVPGHGDWRSDWGEHAQLSTTVVSEWEPWHGCMAPSAGVAVCGWSDSCGSTAPGQAIRPWLWSLHATSLRMLPHDSSTVHQILVPLDMTAGHRRWVGRYDWESAEFVISIKPGAVPTSDLSCSGARRRTLSCCLPAQSNGHESA